MCSYLSACSILLCLAVAVECKTEGQGREEDRPPFRSTKAPAEIIKQYTVHVPVWKNGGEPLNHFPRTLHVEISDYDFNLELNEGLIPPHFTSHYFDENNKEVIETGHINCFYHGRVMGHPDWHVTVSLCRGIQGSFGELGKEDNYYHIEPLDPADPSLMQPHAIYSASEYSKKDETCGTNAHHIKKHLPAVPKSIHFDKNRVRRRVDGFYIVEWAMINDNTQYNSLNRNLSATVLRDLEIANLVDSLFRTLSVRVVVVSTMTWTNGDRIAFPSDNDAEDILDNLRDFEPQITSEHDSTMLITGVDLLGNTVGIAFVGTMCRGRSSVGLSQDGGRTLSSVGSTAAHELGHIFRMNHDDERQCSCSDPSGRCIMAGTSGRPSPVQWSSCSRSDITNGFTNFNLNSCLMNEPQVTVGDPVCGNGIREGDEICDCGSVAECTDSCCNATSCMLRSGAQCSRGECCSSDCQFFPLGTTCRPASQECDILEYCLGDSSDCPRDVHHQDGHLCNQDRDFCFSGQCQVLDNQCQRFFGSSSGIPECYSTFNINGDRSGNCGHNNRTFVPCLPENVQCGQLQCADGNFVRGNIGGTINLFTGSARDPQSSQFVRCRSFTTDISDTRSPGLVADGTRCGNQSLCVSQQCTEIAELSYIRACPVGRNGQTCAGVGVCNNLNLCSCNVGLGGTSCEAVVSGPSNGGDAGAIAGAVVGTLLGLALVAAVAVGVVFLVIKLRSKRQKSYQPPPARRNLGSSSTAKGKSHSGSQDNLLSTTTEVKVVQPSTHKNTYQPPPFSPIESAPPARTPDWSRRQNQPPRPPPGSRNRNAPPPPPPSRVAPPSKPVPPPPAKTVQHPPPPSKAVPPPPNRTRNPPPPAVTNLPPKQPPLAAPKPGKISQQWPPPSEEESNRPLPPPKKPVFPPRR